MLFFTAVSTKLAYQYESIKEETMDDDALIAEHVMMNGACTHALPDFAYIVRTCVYGAGQGRCCL